MTYTLDTHHTGSPGWVAQIYKWHLLRWMAVATHTSRPPFTGSPSFSSSNMNSSCLVLGSLPECSQLFDHFPFWIKTYPDSGVCSHCKGNSSNGSSISPIKCSFGPRLHGSSLLMSNVTSWAHSYFSLCPSTTFSLKLLSLGLEPIISFWKVHIIENWNKKRSKTIVSPPQSGITEQLDS